MAVLIPEIRRWLETFNECVCRKDFEGGKALFYKNIYCFGSYADFVTDIDGLLEDQWKKIWPNISNFRFKTEEAKFEISSNKDLACVMMPWSSTGHTKDGISFDRLGRVTILLRYDVLQKAWLAYHTHYSINPSSLHQLAPYLKQNI